MNATVIDDRRRLVLPAEFKPKSAVPVQVIDAETVLVKLARPATARMVMLLPDVKSFRPDTDWETTEHAFTLASNNGRTPFEE